MRDDDVPPDHVLQYASPGAKEAVNPQSVPAAAAALSAEQTSAIARARELYKPLQRARSWANMDAVTLAIFAALTIPFSLTSPSGLFIGIALAVCAAAEFVAIKKLDRLDENSLKMLALNQIALGIFLMIYAVWNLLEAHYHPERLLGEVDTSGLLNDFKDLAQMIAMYLYTSLIVIAVIVQGGSALYYRSRRKYLQRYVAEVPEWARKI